MSSLYKRVFTVILITASIGCSSVSYGQANADEKDVFAAGVGFGGGLGGPGISYNLLPNYSGTITPGLLITYEHVFTKQFGIGGMASMANASLTASNLPYAIYDSYGNLIQKGTLTDNSKGTYIGIAARSLFHFKGSDNFDPYVGVIFGYTLTSFSSTVTTSQGSYPESSFYPGILFGAVAGLRFYVTKSIGIWAEVGYSGVPDYLANIGIAYKLTRF